MAQPTIGQISDLVDAIRSSKAVKDYWINYFGRDSLAAVLSRLDGNDSRGAAALAENILRHWQPPQPATQPAPTTERTAIIARLRELVGAVIQGPDTVRREFDMRVPADPLRDADLVLSTAARMLETDRAQPVKVTDEELLRTYGLAKRDYCYEGPDDDWPKRAERAATICGLRAVLARCGHSVELVTPPPPSTGNLFRELDQLLCGIDRRVDHPEGGWWETDDGGRFGKIMLRKIKETISRHLRP